MQVPIYDVGDDDDDDYDDDNNAIISQHTHIYSTYPAKQRMRELQCRIYREPNNQVFVRVYGEKKVGELSCICIYNCTPTRGGERGNQ